MALASDEAYNHQLVLLDAQQGQVYQRIPNPNNELYIGPRFSEDGQYILAIKQARESATIVLIHVDTGEAQDILACSNENLGWPCMTQGYVFYNSAYNGIDNIYAIDLKTRQRYQVTSRKYGAYHATLSVDSQQLLCNDFTKDGMDIVAIPLAPCQWLPLAAVQDRTIGYYTPLVLQENNPDLLTSVPEHSYVSKPYHAAKHPMHIHSWMPYCNLGILNKQHSGNDLGLTLYARNLLNTAKLRTSYLYSFTYAIGCLCTKFTYKGWYPILAIRGKLYTDLTKADNLYQVSIKLPFAWMHGQYSHKLTLNTVGTLHQGVLSTYYYSQAYAASFMRAAAKSPRDPESLWKQIVRTSYEHIPYQGKEQVGCREVTTIFPGIWQHYAFNLTASYYYQQFAAAKAYINQPAYQ